VRREKLEAGGLTSAAVKKGEFLRLCDTVCVSRGRGRGADLRSM